MKPIWVKDEDLHPHLRARMLQRGVSLADIEITINEGRQATDAKPGMQGKVFIFPYKAKWEGQFYEEKEVVVYYKVHKGKMILLTVKARYGSFRGGIN